MNLKKLVAVTVLFLLVAVTMGSATVRSCDSLTFSSDADQFDGQQLSCAFTSDFTTDAIQLDISQTELSNRIPSGEADQNLQVSVDQQQSEAVYGFRDTGLESVKLFTYAEEDVDVLCADTTATKQAKVEDAIEGTAYDIDDSGAGDYHLTTADYYAKEVLTWGGCVMRTGYIRVGAQLGSVAEIDSSPSINWETDWTYSAGSTSDSATITNSDVGDQETTQLGEYVTIQWTGNNRGGDIAPGPTDELIIHSNQWEGLDWDEPLRVIDRNNWRTWKDSISDLSRNVENRVKRQITADDRVTESINSQAKMAISEHSSSEFLSGTFDGTSLDGATLNLRIDQIAFPTFQVYFAVCQYIPGDTPCDALVTVQKAVGVPEITDASSDEFQELGTGTIEVTAENIGDAEGSFSLRIENCGSDFAVSDNSARVRLDGGESTVETFTISLLSTDTDQKEITGTCDVQMKEITTGETDRWDGVQVTGVQQNECEPGSQFVKVEETADGNTYDTVQKCGDDGLQWEQILACDPDENAIEEDTTWQCETESEETVNAYVIADDTEQCVGNEYPVGEVPDHAYLDKSACRDAVSGDEICLIDTAILNNPFAEDTRVQAACIDSDILDRLRLVVIVVSGLATGFVGFTLGQWIDGERQIRGPNRYTKRRQIDRRQRGNRISAPAILGGVIGFAVGAAIGWFLGLWAFLVIILLLVLKYISPF